VVSIPYCFSLFIRFAELTRRKSGRSDTRVSTYARHTLR